MSLQQLLGRSDEPDPEGHILPRGYSVLECTICRDFKKCDYEITRYVAYSCCNKEECIKRCESMVRIEQKKNYAYGPLSHLIGADNVRVRRNNGIVEDDWEIPLGGIIIITNIACIRCIKRNIDGSIDKKYVPITDILELNPPVNLTDET